MDLMTTRKPQLCISLQSTIYGIFQKIKMLEYKKYAWCTSLRANCAFINICSIVGQNHCYKNPPLCPTNFSLFDNSIAGINKKYYLWILITDFLKLAFNLDVLILQSHVQTKQECNPLPHAIKEYSSGSLFLSPPTKNVRIGRGASVYLFIVRVKVMWREAIWSIFVLQIAMSWSLFFW